MRKIGKYLLGGILSLAMLFTPTASAMQIQQFEKMEPNDQTAYVTAMIDGVHGDLKHW